KMTDRASAQIRLLSKAALKAAAREVSNGSFASILPCPLFFPLSTTPDTQARRRMRTESGSYRRDHLRALAQRVEVDTKEVRIMGSKSVLPRTLIAASSAKTAGVLVPHFYPKC